jgi:hypothetical protein
MPAAVSFARMELAGIRVDVSAAAQVLDASRAAVVLLRRRLVEHGIDDPNSDDQVMRAIFAADLNTPICDEVRLGSHDIEVMAQHNPVARLVQDYRACFAASSGVVAQCTQLQGNRVHPAFDPLGTVTGRPTVRQPNIIGIPRVLRPIVIPDGPNYGLFEADYSQQEIGMASRIYDDPRLLDDFNNRDVYVAVARDVVGPLIGENLSNLSDHEIKDHHGAIRTRAKVLVLGIFYGMTEAGVAVRLGVDVGTARLLIDRLHDRYPDLCRNMQAQRERAERDGYVETITGLRRYRVAKGKLSPAEERWTINAPVQAAGAALLKILLPRLEAALAPLGARVVLPVFDAVVVQAPLDRLDQAGELTRSLMVDVYQEMFPGVRPRVEITKQDPSCWNKAGDSGSLRRFIEEARGKAADTDSGGDGRYDQLEDEMTTDPMGKLRHRGWAPTKAPFPTRLPSGFRPLWDEETRTIIEPPGFHMRGMAIHPVAFFGVGFCDAGQFAGRLILPVHMFGMLRTFVAWAIDPSVTPQIIVAPGTNADGALYGFDEAREHGHVVFCYGHHEVLKILEAGARGIATADGGEINPGHLLAIRDARFRSVTVLCEADRATEALNAHRQLSRVGTVKLARLPLGVKVATAPNNLLSRALREAV